MTKLIFVHGINQQGKSSDSLSVEWLESLAKALAAAGYAGTPLTPVVPFYGDVLKTLSDGQETGATAQGAGDVSSGEAAFLAEGLEEIAAKDPRVDGNEVAAVADDVAVDAQGLFAMDRRINAIVRVIERVSPVHGDWALRLLKQAYVYLRQPGAAEQIDARVAPAFSDGPCIIVSHSLGTIVSFKLLRRMALEGRPLDVPLFITLGSPLSLRTVRNALGPSFTPPKGIGHWFNAYDKDDFVALGQGLTRSTFAEGIENWGDVNNARGDDHGIAGYLSDSKVVSIILGALAAKV
jgi:hypothetical protein